MTTASDYERVLLVKPEVHVFRIPPRTTNRGYRAADWKLDSPDWISRMKVMAIGKKCFICIEDKNSGELFAKAPIPSYPGEAVESVLDSSRYFVIRIEDESGKKAFIGIGFQDRADSFDFNVALRTILTFEELALMVWCARLSSPATSIDVPDIFKGS
ncbi:putative adaptin ear-binding coat-associated protein 1 [Apostichopus japonicus]|uniref:Putative adaptin ear-binding coat-associated protein 1 n=1 Tax=Stichopus japonicus TaxID=307972 RepID=A0A2G8LKQ7_STIJA|nr:putative adaptin ear-binding coat-associated protein 1 [Apostichopus japonicus]